MCKFKQQIPFANSRALISGAKSPELGPTRAEVESMAKHHPDLIMCRKQVDRNLLLVLISCFTFFKLSFGHFLIDDDHGSYSQELQLVAFAKSATGSA